MLSGGFPLDFRLEGGDMTFLEEQELKLNKLRRKWLVASTNDRRLIETRAKIIKMGIDTHNLNIKEDLKLQEEANSIFNKENT